MIQKEELYYRILYDSLSRFSIFLNKAESLADINACLLKNSKYLYNFSLCRFQYYYRKKFVCYTITNQTSDVQSGESPFFLDVERKVFDSCIPYHEHTTDAGKYFNDIQTSELWIWNFGYGEEAGMLVTLASGGLFGFSKEQIPVLKLVSEMLYTKTRMVLLLDDIRSQQEALNKSHKNLEEKNNTISNLMSFQEKIIEERTKSLTQANASLLEIIQFTSHYIREPLTRILGLMSLSEIIPEQEFFNEYWLLLKESVNDMDATVKSIISKTEIVDEHKNFFN